jgi:hypothetical protein
MNTTKTLIAAPTHECKDYAFYEYYKAIRSIGWDGEKRLLLVDNSPAPDYPVKLVLAGVDDVRHVQPGEHLLDTIDRAWDVILTQADEGGFDYIFSVESDVIVAPESLTLLIDAMERYDACMVRHAYPVRGAVVEGRTYQALGCMLLRTEFFPLGCHRRLTGERWEHAETALVKWALETGKPKIDFSHLFEVDHLSEDGKVHERNVETQVVKLG